MPTENQSVNEQKLESNTNVDSQATSDEQTVPEKAAVEVHKTPEVKSELTAFDLLSDIDFSVEQTPLMPEIKVPQISESAIRKPVAPKIEPEKKVPVKEEAIERPAKRDLFSDPSLLNKFTQEVKNLQKLTDSLTDKSPSGLTVLDAKWKSFQDFQVSKAYRFCFAVIIIRAFVGFFCFVHIIWGLRIMFNLVIIVKFSYILMPPTILTYGYYFTFSSH